MNPLSHRPAASAALSVIALLVAAPALVQAAVLAPNELIAGTDQASLAQQWWNWAAQYTPGTSPVNDTSGALASAGDRGTYFFLAGSSAPSPVVRSVTVQNNQALFFPLINVVSGYTDQQIADFGLTLSGIRSEATNLLGNVSGLFLTLDGADMALPASTANLLAFRQASGVFDLVLPSDDNIFGGPANGAPAGTYRAFTDGYWVGLAPLANGSWQLHFGGSELRTGPFAGQTYAQDITYNISVVPEPAAAALLLAGLGLVAAVAGPGGRRRAG